MRTDFRALYNQAAAIHAAIGVLRRELDAGVIERMTQAEAGLRAVQTDAVGSSGGSVADPTATGALGPADAAAGHRDALAASLAVARAHVDIALAVVDLYPAAHVANAADRALLARLNGRSERGCQSCARLRRPDGEPRWEPLYSKLTEATTVGGRLPEPMLLCRWCYGRVEAWGRLPTPAEAAAHHAGQKVPWPADVPRQASA